MFYFQNFSPKQKIKLRRAHVPLLVLNPIFYIQVVSMVLCLSLFTHLHAQEQEVMDSQASMTLGYQGELYDASQTPLEGSWTLHFRLYTTADGIDSIWEEIHSDVLLEKGHFTVQLGSEVPFPSDLIRETDLFLGLQIASKVTVIDHLMCCLL